MTSDLPTEQECRDVIALIRRHRYEPGGSDLAALAACGIRPLAGGYNNAVYLCGDGARRCCIKFHCTDDRRRRAEREWRALGLLAIRRPGLAPQPLYYDDGAQPAIAMEYLTGQPLTLSPDKLPALAAGLRNFYFLPITKTDYPYMAVGAAAPTIVRISAWARDWQAQAASDALLRDAILLLRRWLTAEDGTLLLRLAAPIYSPGDPNPANWLCQGQSLRRIDLEYAGWSDLALDLADLIEGPWARQPPDDTWEPFVATFDPVDRQRLGAARRLWATFWVGKFAELRRRDPTEENTARLEQQLARARTLLTASVAP